MAKSSATSFALEFEKPVLQLEKQINELVAACRKARGRIIRMKSMGCAHSLTAAAEEDVSEPDGMGDGVGGAASGAAADARLY